jgi:hypothetical protein
MKKFANQTRSFVASLEVSLLVKKFANQTRSFVASLEVSLLVKKFANQTRSFVASQEVNKHYKKFRCLSTTLLAAGAVSGVRGIIVSRHWGHGGGRGRLLLLAAGMMGVRGLVKLALIYLAGLFFPRHQPADPPPSPAAVLSALFPRCAPMPAQDAPAQRRNSSSLS